MRGGVDDGGQARNTGADGHRRDDDTHVLTSHEPKDVRGLVFERDPGAHERIVALARSLRSTALELAAELRSAGVKRWIVEHGCTSIGMYGEALGLERFETRMLIAVDEAIASTRFHEAGCRSRDDDGGQPDCECAPSDVETRLRSLELSLPRAAEIAPVLAACGVPRGEPAAVLGAGEDVDAPVAGNDTLEARAPPDADAATDPGDGRGLFGAAATPADWIRHAVCSSYSRTRRDARRRLAELRCGEAVESVEVQVPDRVAERFHRARTLASDDMGRWLTRDETFEIVVDSYLSSRDPAAVAERPRRTGPTSEHLRSRYVPAAVQRAVRRRARQRCEFPCCRRSLGLELAHRRFHSRGGDREASNLVLLCWPHHVMFDAEQFALLGDPPTARWVHRLGQVYTRESPRGRDAVEDDEREALAQVRERGQQRGEEVRDATDGTEPVAPESAADASPPP